MVPPDLAPADGAARAAAASRAARRRTGARPQRPAAPPSISRRRGRAAGGVHLREPRRSPAPRRLTTRPLDAWHRPAVPRKVATVSTTVREDEGGAPALVGIAAIIGFAKAILEGGFGLIALAASDVIDSSFAGVAVVYAIVFAIASYLLLRGNRIGLWTTVALSVLGLAGAVIYLFYAEDAAFLTA